METLQIGNETELAEVVGKVLAGLREMERQDGAAVLALHGDLGAGKTTFTQHLARALGINEIVTSPTFVVMKRYVCGSDVFTDLVHIDAYRIEDIDEMRPLRFGELLEASNTLVVIEWAEKISELLPQNTLHVTFAIKGEERIITIDGKKN